MRTPAPIIVSLLIAACVACPSAGAEATYGPGTYAVPEQLPHGIYTARTDVRDPGAPECTFSTWTSDWKPITGDSVGPEQSITADITPTVGHFITHGCTPWTKVQ